MAIHKVPLVANKGIFAGLAKQNMLFHQCVGELVDNAIAATPHQRKFKIDIVFSSGPPDAVDLYIADNCAGMTLDHLERALQLGEPATTSNRLNEHGFGLKNALATLSGGNGPWKIWTRPTGVKSCFSAEGPFAPEMHVEDSDTFPTEDFLPSDMSTLIKVTVRTSFIQSVQGRGAPAKDLSPLREWLIEHLGVMYRGYLEQDPTTSEEAGVIVVSIKNDSLRVPPIPVPLAQVRTEYLDVELGGNVTKVKYVFGLLDRVKCDQLVRGKPAKFYYQGNIPTQGIDIRLGKRVIATRQFETIWKTDDGQHQLSRHNNYNDFLGELSIGEQPRGILTTVNNKTDFNLDDPDWRKIFERINGIRPPKQPRETSEAELRKKWIKMLKATNPDDTVTDDVNVWPTGTAIDVYRKTPQDRVIIYELKAGTGSPINLYQLKMYWDGLVLDKKEQPSEAVLLVEDFNNPLELMANMMNQLPVPSGSKPYNFKIERLKDKGLL